MVRGLHRNVEYLYDMLREQLTIEDFREILESGFAAQKVREDGDELHCSCLLPFGEHKRGDRKPSAAFNIDKLVYNCFGCGRGGDFLWLVQVCGRPGYDEEECTREEALDYLSSLVTPKEKSGTQLVLDLQKIFSPVYEETSYPVYSPEVLKPWMVFLDWLEETRGITEETAKKFQLGYDEDAGRLIIPHFFKGELVGWQGRAMLGQDPRYKNTDDFPKKSTLYNYDEAVRKGRVFVVEAPLSAVWMSQNGYNTVATFGAKVTSEQLLLLSCFSEVVVFFDDDKAGESGLRTIVEGLRGPFINAVDLAGLKKSVEGSIDLSGVQDGWVEKYKLTHDSKLDSYQVSLNDPGDCGPEVLQELVQNHVIPAGLLLQGRVDPLSAKIRGILKQ